MDLAIFWAALVGAGLGLDRTLRDLEAGWLACGVAAGTAAVAGAGLVGAGATANDWFWPLTLAGCTVAIGMYLAKTRAPAGVRRDREPGFALLAAVALGLAMGVGAHRFVGVAGLVGLYTLGWRLLDDDGASAPQASVPPPPIGASNLVHVGRRPEEGRHDNESGQKREDQRDGEQLAHAGGAGMTGQA